MKIGPTVRGKQVIAPAYFGNIASNGIFALGGGPILIEANQATGWEYGIRVTGTEKTVRKNEVLANIVGIESTGINPVVQNVVSANRIGIVLFDAVTAVGNAVQGNVQRIQVDQSFTGSIEKNNLFGNPVWACKPSRGTVTTSNEQLLGRSDGTRG